MKRTLDDIRRHNEIIAETLTVFETKTIDLSQEERQWVMREMAVYVMAVLTLKDFDQLPSMVEAVTNRVDDYLKMLDETPPPEVTDIDATFDDDDNDSDLLVNGYLNPNLDTFH